MARKSSFEDFRASAENSGPLPRRHVPHRLVAFDTQRTAANERASLLTPVAKAFSTDIANEVALARKLCVEAGMDPDALYHHKNGGTLQAWTWDRFRPRAAMLLAMMRGESVIHWQLILAAGDKLQQMGFSLSDITGTSTGNPPVWSTPRLMSCARSRKCVWQVLNSLQVLRIATTGLPA